MKSFRTSDLLGRIGVTADAMRRKLRAHVTGTVIARTTIDRPPHEVYAYFRWLQQQLASYVEADAALDPRPAAVEIVEDRAAELVSWRSKQGDGRVTLTRGPGRGTTEVKIELEVGPLSRLFMG